MIIIIILVLAFILIMVGTGLIVIFVIKNAGKENQKYQKFAKQNNYMFDKGMAKVSNYRDYSKNKVSLAINIPNSNPYIDKYANYESFPFGRGSEKCISYIIEGKYKTFPFRAFTYSFTGRITDGVDGGVYAVILVRTNKEPKTLPEHSFYENGISSKYKQGNLNVEEIHTTLDSLLNLVNE